MVRLLLLAALAGAAMGEELALKDLEGHPQALEGLRGRIVVLNFWATWCIPCRREMPMLASVQSKYAGRGVQVIGASLDDESGQRKIPDVIRRLGVTFLIWTGATPDDLRRLGLGDALPATAIVDRDGQIVARLLGPVKRRDLEQRLDWLLGDRSGPRPGPVVNNAEEEHPHTGAAMEGASLVPS